MFLAGCTAYFFVVTLLNHYTDFEGLLGICYGTVLYGYCLLATEGKKTDFFLLSTIWVLIAFISAYVMFAAWGIITGEELGKLLETDNKTHLYFSLAAGALRFSLGRMALAIYRRKQQSKLLVEDWIMALIFLVFFLLILFVFRLEEGGMAQRERYYLSLWILGGFFFVILLLGGVYQFLGKYRLDRMAEEYREENQRLQAEQIHDLYQIGREANRMRHDMGAKINVVYGQMKKGAYKEAEESLKRLGAEWGDYHEIPPDTGNVSGVDSLDMGNLVHNLLQNGIEACCREGKERELEIVVRREIGSRLKRITRSPLPSLKRTLCSKRQKRKKKSMDLAWRAYGRSWGVTREAMAAGRKTEGFSKGSC